MRQPELAGLYHVAASGETNWHSYACFVLEQARAAGLLLKVAPEQIAAIASSAYPTAAKRPLNSRLNTDKLQSAFALHLPSWQSGVARMLSEYLEKCA
jgi:dTDP-4-dehydrorhamnose reductase